MGSWNLRIQDFQRHRSVFSSQASGAHSLPIRVVNYSTFWRVQTPWSFTLHRAHSGSHLQLSPPLSCNRCASLNTLGRKPLVIITSCISLSFSNASAALSNDHLIPLSWELLFPLKLSNTRDTAALSTFPFICISFHSLQVVLTTTQQ